MQMSPAEILDKASILKVKMGELPNGKILGPQYEACLRALRDFSAARLDHYLGLLYTANLAQWHANESLFKMLAEQEKLDDYRLDLAEECIRTAHAHNKERVKIKNEIAAEFGGEREEKSFACSL